MSSIHPSVIELLARLRGRIRTHIALDTLALATLLVVATFWLGLLGDWFFEPDSSVRLVAWLVLGAAVIAVVVRFGIRRLAVPLTNDKLAHLLETKHDELGNEISTAIDLGRDASDMHEELVARSHQEAAVTAESFRESQVMNRGRLRWLGATCIGGLLSIVALAIFAPQVWSVYSQRLALADVAWPRTVELSIDGFTQDEKGRWVRKVARFDDVPLRVNASLIDGFRDPKRVRIRYRWDGGRRGRDELTRIGDAEKSGSEYQEYNYNFERIDDSVEFDLRGGDGRLRRLRLEVVDRPKVVELKMEVEYPDYLLREPGRLPVGPQVELPEGASGVIVGTTNKPLSDVAVESGDGILAGNATTDGSTFRIPLNNLADDANLRIELVDNDGIGSREPFTVTLAARRDEMPQVTANRDGIGTAVTPIAMIPLSIELSDDYRLTDSWLELAAADVKPLKISVTEGRALGSQLNTRQVIDLRALRSSDNGQPLDLAVNDRFSIVVSATDAFNLGDEQHVGSARRIPFEVVSEDELLSRLARSELNLRQTFESITDKLIVLYDDLEQLEPITTDDESSDGSEDEVDAPSTDSGESNDATAEAAGETTAEPEEEFFDRVALQKARLEETAKQLSTETVAVADGFQSVYLQLQNNRVDNSELLDRIGNRIVKPLNQLGSSRLPEIAERVASITDDPATQGPARAATREAIREAEEILREMQGLENYNEVIAMLRDLIKQQEELSEKTKAEQQNQLRDLLLD